MEIWEPKPPGTLWATPGLLRDSFIKLNRSDKVWFVFIIFFSDLRQI